MVVGPALAGLITAAAGGHLQACYLIDAVSFGAALYGVAGLPAMPPEPVPPGPACAPSPRASASSGAVRSWQARSWPT